MKGKVSSGGFANCTTQIGRRVESEIAEHERYMAGELFRIGVEFGIAEQFPRLCKLGFASMVLFLTNG